MRYLPVIFGVVVIIYGLIDCLRTEPAAVRSLPKPAWILIILLLPLLGAFLWFFFGHPHNAAAATAPRSSSATNSGPRSGSTRAPQFRAPDDDPEFLRNLEVNRAQKAEAERLRKLQADIAAREAAIRAREQGEQAPGTDQPKDETQH